MCAMSKIYIAPTLSAICRMRAKSHNRGYALAPPMMTFRLFALGDCLEFVVVDDFGIAAHGVKRGVVKLAAETQLVPVGQVAAMGEIEAQNRIAGLQHCHVGGGIGLRAGVWLDIGKLSREDLPGTIARQILHHVGVLTTTVVAASRITLGIFVGEHGAGGLEHRLGDEVFAGDHLQAFVLTEGFVVNGGGNFRVGLSQG